MKSIVYGAALLLSTSIAWALDTASHKTEHQEFQYETVNFQYETISSCFGCKETSLTVQGAFHVIGPRIYNIDIKIVDSEMSVLATTTLSRRDYGWITKHGRNITYVMEPELKTKNRLMIVGFVLYCDQELTCSVGPSDLFNWFPEKDRFKIHKTINTVTD